MTHKFKVGDKIFCLYGDNTSEETVVAVADCRPTTVPGLWWDGSTNVWVENGYILQNKEGLLWYLHFSREYDFDLVPEHVSEYHNPCPICKSKTQEYETEGFLPGSKYKGYKCTSCGHLQ